jgi:hypothetical protein
MIVIQERSFITRLTSEPVILPTKLYTLNKAQDYRIFTRVELVRLTFDSITYRAIYLGGSSVEDDCSGKRAELIKTPSNLLRFGV